jgi:hypothetical protein
MRVGILVAAIISALLVCGNAAAQTDQFFDSNGVTIRYTQEGQGEPVILLHGSGGSLATWTVRKVAPQLSERRGGANCRRRGQRTGTRMHQSFSGFQGRAR